MTRAGDEEHDRHQTEPERRHREADVGDAGEHVVADRVLLHRRVDADTDREQRPRTWCPEDQVNRRARARWIIAEHRVVGALHSIPRSPCTTPCEPVPPLHDDRVVEAQAVPAAAADAPPRCCSDRYSRSGSNAIRRPQNVRNDATTSTGTEYRTRRAMYVSMAPYPRLAVARQCRWARPVRPGPRLRTAEAASCRRRLRNPTRRCSRTSRRSSCPGPDRRPSCSRSGCRAAGRAAA